MKYMLVVLILFFSSQSIHSQVDTLDVSVLSDIGLNMTKIRQLEFQAYVDSLNNYRAGDDIPNFMLDECFDRSRRDLVGFHSNISLRWRVLENVKNKRALKLMIEMNDGRLKKKCSEELKKTMWINVEVHLINKSYSQLIKKRYLELK
jgi:hypothetical protein